MDNRIIEGKECPYCGRDSKYVDSSVIYGTSYGMVYLCQPCDAYVGVHEGTDKALGRLANYKLRKAKQEAHFYFDKLWEEKKKKGFSKSKARGMAYLWLSQQLGLSVEETHIGWFDNEMCKKVVNICKPITEKLKL